MLLTLTVALALTRPVQGPSPEFVKAFSLRKGNIATAKADPAISKSMDLLIEDLAQKFKDKSSKAFVDIVVRNYVKELKGDSVPATDYRSMNAAVSSAKDRLAIGVRMGGASRLRVFDKSTMQLVKLPSEFDWVYGYDSRPMFLDSGFLTVDAPAVKDMGIRYPYRFHFMKEDVSRFMVMETQSGRWNLPGEDEDEHAEIHGDIVTLRTISPPKSFTVADTLPLFRTYKILVVDSWPYKTRMTGKFNDSVAFVDQWIGEAMKSPKDKMQREFAKLYGNKPRALVAYSEKPRLPDHMIVRLTFDKTYEFVVEPGFESKLVSFQVVPKGSN